MDITFEHSLVVANSGAMCNLRNITGERGEEGDLVSELESLRRFHGYTYCIVPMYHVGHPSGCCFLAEVFCGQAPLKSESRRRAFMLSLPLWLCPGG
jgi:hypothetical protein